MCSISMFLLLLCLCFITLLCYKFYKTYTYWTRKGVKNASFHLWFKILSENIIRANEESYIFKQLYHKFKMDRFVGIHCFHQPILLVCDPELIKKITIQEYSNFSSHSVFLPSKNEPIWTRNLLFFEYDEWNQFRKILSQLFSGTNLRVTISSTQNYSDNLIKYLQIKFRNGVQVFDVKKLFTCICNDIMASLTFGVVCDSLNENNEFITMAAKAAMFPAIRTFRKFFYFLCPKLTNLLHMKVINKESAHFFKKLVDESLKLKSQRDVINNDIINLFIKINKAKNKLISNETENVENDTKLEISKDEIASQGILFLFAGLEALSGILSYICYHLAVNPDIQNKVYNEIMSNVDDTGKISSKNINLLQYLDNVIFEVIRLHPPSGILDRKCVKSCVITTNMPNKKPLYIEKGTWIWMLHKEIQCDEKYFSNPEKFDPDRFNEKNKHFIQEYTYLPFGSGPKMCIANRLATLVLKIVIADLITNFELIPVPETKCIADYGISNIYPINTKGMWLRLNTRTKEYFE